MCVGGVVIHHQMHRKTGGHIGLDVTQERQIFLMPMAWLARGQYFARGRIQGGKQRRGCVPNVIMGDALDVA